MRTSEVLASVDVRKAAFVVIMTLAAMIVLGGIAQAITAPGSGSFAYSVYDIGVNKILKGPVGFVGGVVAITIGAMMAMRAQVLPAVASILGGGVLLGADNIVSSMGSIIF